MVKNYDRFGKTNIKVYTGHKVVWQRYIRSLVNLATEFDKEDMIKEAHRYFNALQNDKYRIRAYKRFGKWLRETED